MVKSVKQKFRQVAALCFRGDRDDAVEVLLVTTRESGRWILPKGWPIKGLKRYEAAETEALEEAGITGRVTHRPIGQFSYDKQFPKRVARVAVDVFLLEVEAQHDDWLEKGQREVRFFSRPEAARLVSDIGAAKLIEQFSVADMDETAAQTLPPAAG